MTELTPKRKRIRTSKWSALVSTSGRGYDLVIRDGLRSGKVSYSLVLDQRDWFINIERTIRCDHAQTER